MPEQLPNKPLVEALLELKWVPVSISSTANDGAQPWSDPAYPLFLGILYENLKDKFPAAEELPAKQLPDILTAGLVKERFRVSPGGWPLFQAGPGILSINFTASYSWDVFRPTALDVYMQFLEAYKIAGHGRLPRLTAVTLRYIDAILTDEFHEPDNLRFIADKLHVSISLPEVVTKMEQVSGPAQTVDLRLAYQLDSPRGSGHLRIATGQKDKNAAIVCEFSVLAREEESPQTVEDMAAWLDKAHEVIEAWFYALVEGELLDVFRRSPR